MNNKKLISILAVIGFVIASSVWFGQNNGLLPQAAGDEALLYDRLFNTLAAIAFGMFLLIQGLIIFSVFRFRQRKGDNTDGPAIYENLRLELIWTAIPIVMVLWVAIFSFDTYTSMQGIQAVNNPIAHNHHHSSVISLAMPAAQADTLPSSKVMAQAATDSVGTGSQATDVPISVDVSAMQFAWIFSYPNTEITTAELHVPIGQKVKLNLSAVDVIHAFWVPQLRLKQDVIPGLPTYLEFTPNKVGEYPIVCAELCGSYHGGMKATMVVNTPEDYAAWLKEQQEVASLQPNRAIAALNSIENTKESEFIDGKSQSVMQGLGIDRNALSQMQQHLKHQTHDLVTDGLRLDLTPNT